MARPAGNAILGREGRGEHIGPGTAFGEGEPADCFYVLLEGEVVLSRRVGADDVELNRTSQPGVYAGAVQVYLGDRVPQVYTASLRAARPSRFCVLSSAAFDQMLQDWFPMMLHLLEGLFIVSQRERLLALGSLSAEPARAEQPGGSRPACHAVDARAGCWHAAQAGDNRRRVI